MRKDKQATQIESEYALMLIETIILIFNCLFTFFGFENNVVKMKNIIYKSINFFKNAH